MQCVVVDQLSDEDVEVQRDAGHGLQPVHALSDDEGQRQPQAIVASASVKRKSSKSKAARPCIGQIRKQINKILCGVCRCARRRRDGHNCFAALRGK